MSFICSLLNLFKLSTLRANPVAAPSVEAEPGFAWLEDAIDIQEDAVNSDWTLPSRTRAQAAAIENYKETLEAYKSSRVPAYGSSRTKSNKARRDDDTLASVVSPVFEMQASDALGTCGTSIAHLIPHDAGCSIFYEEVAVGALGEELNDRGNPVAMTRTQKQSLIHGSRSGNVASRFVSDSTRGLRRSVRKRKSKTAVATRVVVQRKTRHTGLKHCALNKIQLLGHDAYDKHPYILLIPCLDEDSILGWTPGQNYDIIGLVGSCGRDNEVKMDHRQLFDKCRVASKENCKVAISSLRLFICGLAANLKRMEGSLQELVNLSNKHDRVPNNEMEELKVTWKHLQNQGQIKIPVFSEDKFIGVSIAERTLTQSIPDPYLVVVKAAVNWCNYHGQKVLPGCPYEYEDEEYDSCCASSAEGHEMHPPVEIRCWDGDVSDLE